MTFRESEMLAEIGWIYKLRVLKAKADRSRADANPTRGAANGFHAVRVYHWKVSAARRARQSPTFLVAG
jgi:hypothetical protein